MELGCDVFEVRVEERQCAVAMAGGHRSGPVRFHQWCRQSCRYLPRV